MGNYRLSLTVAVKYAQVREQAAKGKGKGEKERMW